MSERVNNPASHRNNLPSREMIATRYVEKLWAMAEQLLWEARRLSGGSPEDTVGGWSAERTATASISFWGISILASSTDKAGFRPSSQQRSNRSLHQLAPGKNSYL